MSNPIQDNLDANQAARITTNPDDLMVVGGEKYDISKPSDKDKPLPRYVFDGKKIYDLDTPLSEEMMPVEMKDTVVIDNRVLSIGDFGDDGRAAIVELYEGFLKVHQNEVKTILCTADGSDMVLDLIKDDGTQKRICGRFLPDGRYIKYINWGDPTVTFEQWLHVSAARCRWKIQWELKDRLSRGTDILKAADFSLAKSITEVTLIAIEKFLALSDKSRLIGV